MAEDITFVKVKKGRISRPATTRNQPLQNYYMDIETVIAACQSIASEMQKRGENVEVLIPASRDAHIPTRLLAMYLGGLPVSFSFPDRSRRLDGRCMIVDDASYTGKTLKSIVKRFKEQNLACGTACVVMGENTTFVPDFHAIACSAESHVVFPWQKDFLREF